MPVLNPNEIMFTAFEPKVANRFIMYIDGIPAYLIKKATAPGFEANEIILDHINVYRKVKGKVRLTSLLEVVEVNEIKQKKETILSTFIQIETQKNNEILSPLLETKNNIIKQLNNDIEYLTKENLRKVEEQYYKNQILKLTKSKDSIEFKTIIYFTYGIIFKERAVGRTSSKGQCAFAGKTSKITMV